MAKREQELPELAVLEQRLQGIREFNHLMVDYWSNWKKEKPELRAKIDEAIAEQGDERAQKEFLWETVRQRIIDGSTEVLRQLEGPAIKDFYWVGREEISVEDYQKEVRENPKKYKVVFEQIHAAQQVFLGIALDTQDEPFYFPYKGLDKSENPDLANVCANLGHDLHKFAGLHPYVYALPNMCEEDDPVFDAQKEVITPQLPFLYPGVVWLFESFKLMAEKRFPQRKLDFSRLCQTVFSEGVVRAFNPYYQEFCLQGKSLRSKLWEEKTQRELLPEFPSSFSVEAKIQPGMKLAGNEAGLHLVLYQLVKNSAAIQQVPINEVEKAEIKIAAGKCQINDQEMIAFRVSDNGPGIDIAGILRAKQKLLLESGRPLSASEQAVASDWACLDLRIKEVIDFIFERRVSGAERRGSHSGIGLALAKEIIDLHGGCIWATNLPGRKGAKFLVILDPSGEGKLRQGLPELFDIQKTPANILGEIDRQLDELKNSV